MAGVRITRVHLEEDTGKTHHGSASGRIHDAEHALVQSIKLAEQVMGRGSEVLGFVTLGAATAYEMPMIASCGIRARLLRIVENTNAPTMP